MKQTTALIALAAAVVLAALLMAGCPKQTTEPTTAPPGTDDTGAMPAPPVTKTAAEPPENIGNAKNAEGKYICPVLGEPVTDFSPENSVEYEGKAYFFCCPSCKPKFEEDPAKYAKAAAVGETPEGSAPAEGSEHPEPAKTDSGA